MLSLSLFLAAAAPAAGAPEGPAHSVANINDPRSHGVLGDSLLSLNEVILLNKRQLTVPELSAAEQAQIFGPGPDIAWGDIDATTVPVITLERALDPIEDQLHGLVVQGSLGRVVIDLNGYGPIVATSNFVDFRGLEIRNGAAGIVLAQTNAVYGTVFADLRFTQISSTAITVLLQADGGTTRVEFEDCEFDQVPTAIEIFDTGRDRTGQLLFHGVVVQGGQLGIGTHLGPGGAYVVQLERSSMQGTAAGIVLDRPTAADDRLVILNALHVRTGGGAAGLVFEGAAGIADALTLRMVDLQGTVRALQIGPLGAGLRALVEDSRLSGPVDLLAGGHPLGVDAANLRLEGGTLTAGTTGGPLAVVDTIFEGVATTTQGSRELRIIGSRFVQGSLQGQVSAPVQVEHSHLGGALLGASVAVQNQLGAPQLGSCDAAPLVVAPGGGITLAADLPPNLLGVWFVGIAETIPIIAPRPLHLYFFLSAYVTLPVVVHNQDQLPLPIPNSAVLSGWDWVAQLAVLPNPGFSAPPLSLPPGRMFSVR